MKFYQVHVTTNGGCSNGYVWFTSRAEAEREKREHDKEEAPYEATIDVIEVKPTKAGILDALQRHASYPDNG
jgi:hypothetical protein